MPQRMIGYGGGGYGGGWPQMSQRGYGPPVGQQPFRPPSLGPDPNPVAGPANVLGPAGPPLGQQPFRPPSLGPDPNAVASLGPANRLGPTGPPLGPQAEQWKWNRQAPAPADASQPATGTTADLGDQMRRRLIGGGGANWMAPQQGGWGNQFNPRMMGRGGGWGNAPMWGGGMMRGGGQQFDQDQIAFRRGLMPQSGGY